jgi:hypothetical protein
MALSRKQFLRISGALVGPFSFLGLRAAAIAEDRPSLLPDLSSFDVRQFGAKGDGRTNDTAAIQAAIEAAGQRGGTVVLSAGRYSSGTIRFRSHVAIYLEAGATLLASPDQHDFEPYEKLSFESGSDTETTDFHYALLRGQDVENVSIRGPGTIDGNRTRRHGPKPIALKNCRHVQIRDITIRNAPNYNVSLLGCDQVVIDGLTILNGYCDGIDPDCCRDVRIANCYVESWDDAIVPKASFALGYRRSTERVTVTNCVLTTASNAFKLGTESSGDFKDITVSNCIVFARPDLWNRRPTSGISVEMVDGASVEQVAISNITMRDVESPLFIRLGNRGRAQAAPEPGRLGGLSISNIVVSGAGRASSITGIPGHPVRQLTLRNLRLTMQGGGSAELAGKAIPELADRYPDASMFGDLPAYGLFCRHAEGVVLDGIIVDLAKPDGRPAMLFEDVNELELRGISAAPPAGNEPVLRLRNVRTGFLQGNRARTGTKTFLELAGEQTNRIGALGNDLSEAATPFAFDKEVQAAALHQEGNSSRGSGN